MTEHHVIGVRAKTLGWRYLTSHERDEYICPSGHCTVVFDGCVDERMGLCLDSAERCCSALGYSCGSQQGC